MLKRISSSIEKRENIEKHPKGLEVWGRAGEFFF